MNQELLLILLSISNIIDSISCGPIPCFNVNCRNCPLNMVGFDYIEPIEVIVNEPRIDINTKTNS